MAAIDAGQLRRHVSSTQMNRESSRSHLVMSVIIEATNLQTQNVTKGKLSFVDLAGSERCGAGPPLLALHDRLRQFSIVTRPRSCASSRQCDASPTSALTVISRHQPGAVPVLVKWLQLAMHRTFWPEGVMLRMQLAVARAVVCQVMRTLRRLR
jgi:hypothetical protein